MTKKPDFVIQQFLSKGAKNVMTHDTKSDLIIEEFRYAQSQLKKQISDLKDQEARLFRKMLDDLQTIHHSQCADSHCLRVEHAGALE